MKRQLITLILFLCLVVPIGAMLTWLHLQQIIIKKQVKEQIKAGLERKDLVLLEFSTVEALPKFKWKNRKEFWYKGKLYDIVEQGNYGNLTFYLCWNDYKESQLDKKFHILLAHILGKIPRKRDNQKRIGKFFKSLYYSESLSYPVFFNLIERKRQPDNFACLHTFYPPLTPPPDKA